MSFSRYVLIAAFLGASWPALAQARFPLPPADIPMEDDAPVIMAQESSSLLLRIDRLEGQLRSMTGQIEQMQFQQRKLEEIVRKLQGDGEARVTDPNARPAVRPIVPAGRRPATGDAFDPALSPNAPGVPRPLGQPYGLPTTGPGVVPDRPVAPPVIPQGPIALDPDDPNKPVELVPNGLRPPRAPVDPAFVAPPRGTAFTAPPVIAVPGNQPVQSAPAAVPADDYDQGIALYKQGQYADAETRLASFVQKNPKDHLVPEAIFYIGESFFQRQRQREAAEQFLKISTDYPKASRAPDALVRLGMSLNAMGAKEQACATFGEVQRKYPAASAAIRGAARESKRAQC